MKIERKTTQMLALTALLAISNLAHSQTFSFTTLDDPSGTQGTWGYGISGSNIVGFYGDNDGGTHGFFYNGTSYTTLDYPGVPNFTRAYGLDGTIVVGEYQSHGYGSPEYGFLYNGTSYISLNDPSANSSTFAEGVSGTKIVGYFGFTLNSVGLNRAFVYNINDGTWITLNDPLAGNGGNQGTYAAGISGDNIVGGYRDSNEYAHGFIYNGSSFITIDDPLAHEAVDQGTTVTGIFGSKMVGTYNDSNGKIHGFLYNGNTFTTIDDPLGADGTRAEGISGDEIVGSYYDSSGLAHGFVAQEVPEPSTFCFLAIGLGAFAFIHNRRKRLVAQLVGMDGMRGA